MKELLPDKQNYVNDNGDVLPVDNLNDDEIDNLAEEYDTKMSQLREKNRTGVYVTLEDRAVAIEALAHIYAHQNRARGLSKATNIPGYRRELNKRYHNVDEVADGAAKNSLQEYASIDSYMQILTKEDDLKNAGFDWMSVEDTAAETQISVRAAIGTDKMNDGRQKIVRRVNSTAKRVK